MNLSSYNVWLCSRLLHKLISGFASFALRISSYLRYSMRYAISFVRFYRETNVCRTERFLDLFYSQSTGLKNLSKHINKVVFCRGLLIYSVFALYNICLFEKGQSDLYESIVAHELKKIILISRH